MNNKLLAKVILIAFTLVILIVMYSEATAVFVRAQCSHGNPVDCGNGYCCPADYPICGKGEYGSMCFTYTSTTTTAIPLQDCMLYIGDSWGGTTSPAPGQHFIQGCTPQIIEAIPDSEHIFSHWDSNGKYLGRENPITVETTEITSITAVFVMMLSDCMFYINVSPTEGGTTSPQYSWMMQGCVATRMRIEAIPNPGYTFSYWWGCAENCVWVDNPITVLYPYVTSITAVFMPTTSIKCLSEELYGEGSEETELLRYIRDNVLSQTPEGREIIKLYYQWSPIIVKAMKEDEEFKEDVREMIDRILGLVGGAE